MTPKKQSPNREPFLNTVARKLGYAAGELTNAAQGLTDNISALPKTISSKVPKTTASGSDSANLRRKPGKKRTASTPTAQRRRTPSQAKAGRKKSPHVK